MSVLRKFYQPDEQDTCDEKGRVYFYDNLRFILICFVVLRHFFFRIGAESRSNPELSSFDEIASLFMVVLSFLMPLFIFITGYYSKSVFSKTGSFRVSRIINFFVLFVVMDTIILLTTAIVKGHFQNYNDFGDYLYRMLDMDSAQWYLFACGIWFLLIPIFKRVPAKIMIPLSFVIGIFGGFIKIEDGFLSIVKLYTFLPFFVIGYYITDKQIKPMLNLKMKFRLLAVLFFVLFFVLTVIYRDSFIHYVKPILEGKNSYYTMYSPKLSHIPPLYMEPFIRVLWYIGLLVSSFFFLLLIPRVKLFFTLFGSRTLSVYIWHSVLVRVLTLTPFYYYLISPPREIGEVLLIIICFVSCLFLSLNFMGAPFNLITKIVLKIPDINLKSR